MDMRGSSARKQNKSRMDMDPQPEDKSKSRMDTVPQPEDKTKTEWIQILSQETKQKRIGYGSLARR